MALRDCRAFSPRARTGRRGHLASDSTASTPAHSRAEFAFGSTPAQQVRATACRASRRKWQLQGATTLGRTGVLSWRCGPSGMPSQTAQIPIARNGPKGIRVWAVTVRPNPAQISANASAVVDAIRTTRGKPAHPSHAPPAASSFASPSPMPS